MLLNLPCLFNLIGNNRAFGAIYNLTSSGLYMILPAPPPELAEFRHQLQENRLAQDRINAPHLPFQPGTPTWDAHLILQSAAKVYKLFGFIITKYPNLSGHLVFSNSNHPWHGQWTVRFGSQLLGLHIERKLPTFIQTLANLTLRVRLLLSR